MKICIDWKLILIAIILSNLSQTIFEAALAYSIELTYRPTPLDKRFDPESNDDEEGSGSNPDKKIEPNCTIVIAKCWGELVAILLYVTMTALLVIGLLRQIEEGKPMTGVVEFCFAFLIDQFKSIPLQLIIWWTVIRRCGKFDVVEDFTEWDDEQIFLGGAELSLLQFIRQKVKNFLENKYIYQLILGMTIFLCVVIFSELSL